MLHTDSMSQEMPEVYLDFLAILPQCSEVGVLPKIDLRIMRGRLNLCSEVLDLDEIVLLSEDIFKQAREVQPFPRSASKLTVVEIETVDIDDGSQTLFFGSSSLRGDNGIH